MDAPTEPIWFNNDGGSLLILPRAAASSWEGGDPPSGGRIVEARFRWKHDVATDYDRACDVEAWAAVIEVGPSWGLVVNSEVGAAAWITLPGTDDFLVAGVLYANDCKRSTILDLCGQQTEDAWSLVHPSLLVEDDGLLLMHAASRVGEICKHSWRQAGDIVRIGGALVYPASGRFSASVCEIERPDVGHYILNRFRRI